MNLQLFGMKNLDILQQQKAAIFTKINQAIKDGKEEDFSAAFEEWTNMVQEACLAEAKGLVQAADNTILAGRGVRALTSEENKYYEKLIGAMKSGNPKQELTIIDDVLPKTVIDAVFEDITEDHPLLDAINFQNTAALTEILISTQDGRHMATWGELCDAIITELAGSFSVIDLEQKKLSAFIPVCNAMLEIGPAWLDRYVRTILAEAIANGLEEAIIDGNGLSEPTGMRRNPGGDWIPRPVTPCSLSPP
jgi:HK97 family phage major capsid protein